MRAGGHIRRRAKREKRLVAITVMRWVDDLHRLSTAKLTYGEVLGVEDFRKDGCEFR